MRSRIAFQLVGHQTTGPTTLPSYKLTEEPGRGIGIALLLDKYIDDITVLINRAVEIMLFPPNADKYFVHMPRVPIATVPPTQSSRVAWPEFLTPPPDRLVRDRHAAFGEEILDVPKAKRESMVQPDSVLDDVRWETAAVAQGFRCFHPCSVTEVRLI